METIDRFNFFQLKEMEPEDTFGDSNVVDHGMGEYIAEKYLTTKDHTVEYMGGIWMGIFCFLLGCATSGIILYLADKGKTVWMQ